jgi:phosphoribosylamine--glycine ligase
MAVGGWFGGAGFSKHFCENWEFKKLMNDDLGVATGEQGTILRYTEESKLVDKVLKPLEDYLHAHAYTGYIDVNCIITDDGTAWPLEFTMRPGWPLFQIQQALHKGDPAEWMLDLIDGKDTLKVSKDVACGVVISIPDYPYSRLTKKECSGYPLWGVTQEDAVTDIHLSEVQWGKAPEMNGDKVKLDQEMYVTAGDYVCTVTATGDSVGKSKDKCYKKIKDKIEIPNSIMYRTDIGCRLEDQIPKLNKMGYCNDLSF